MLDVALRSRNISQSIGTFTKPIEKNREPETTDDHEAIHHFHELADTLGKLADTPDFLKTAEGLAFQEDCEYIYNELSLVLKDKQEVVINISVGDTLHSISFTEEEGSTVLKMGNNQVRLDNKTLATLFENLYRSINVPLSATIRFSELGWKGRIYNSNKPLPKESDHGYKNQPYKSKLPLHLNGKATFTETKPDSRNSKKIVCRHLVTQFIKDCWENKKNGGKVLRENYLSIEAISKHIKPEIENDFSLLNANAKSYNLIHNDQLGKHIYACFNDMRTNKETLKTLYIGSTDHCMGIRLRVKGTETNPVFVVSFFDPNSTTSVMRCESTDPSTFINHTLEQYITGSKVNGDNRNYYAQYYGNVGPISLVMECNLDSFDSTNSNANISSTTENKLINFTSDPLTPAHMYFLLGGAKVDFSADLTGLKAQLLEIGRKSPKELLNLLAAKGANNKLAFHKAILQNNTEVIKICAEVLIQLSLNQQFSDSNLNTLLSLFDVKDDLGTGLYGAIYFDYSEVIQLCGNVLIQVARNQSLSASDVKTLLNLFAAKRDGTSGLHIAMILGNTKAINACTDILQKLLPHLQLDHSEHITILQELFFAKNGNGAPGLYNALDYGRADSIRAYSNLLQVLPQNKREMLLSTMIKRPAFWQQKLIAARENGRGEAVEAFQDLLRTNMPNNSFNLSGL